MPAAPVLQFKRGNAGVAGTVPALRPGEPAISLNNFDFFIGIDTSVTNNKFFGSHRYWEREDGTNALKLKLVSNNGQESINLRAPTGLGATFTYTLPATGIGNSGKVLTTNEDGTLSWIDSVNVFSVENIVIGIGTFINNVGFTTDTDNTLGIPTTGAVTIAGGVGIAKNLTVGAGLSVAGQSYFIGTATFYGGTINLGNETGDVINIDGRIDSHLVPTTDATFDVGITTLRWKDSYFSGIGSFDGGVNANALEIGIGGNGDKIKSTTGVLSLDASTHVLVSNDLHVGGNVTVGGTTVTLLSQDVFIKNKDIVLGYTTSITNQDASTDTTANHGGVAIASTEGSPLCSFTGVGNTLPDTYKQMMWFQNGYLGFSTDAFAFNYGVAIGTTTMANGVRLAVGTGVTVSDTAVSATTFYGALSGSITGNAASADQVKTVTASNTNGTYYVTFVDANNGSATNESVYTDDGIYYNPGSNTFTTQHAEFTGNVLVGIGLSVVGVSTFSSLVDANAGLDVTGQTTLNNNLTVTGVSTFTDAVTANGNVTLGSDGSDTLTVNANATFGGTVTFQNASLTGTISTATRATQVDTTGTSTNADYFVTFVDTFAGEISETLRVGAGVSVNPSDGSVKTEGILSVGKNANLTSFIKSGGGSNAMYIYDNGDVSFQQQLIGVGATFSQNLYVSGIATIGNDLTVGGDVRINGNDIKASDGNANITLTSNTLTSFAGDIKVGGNDIQASDGTTALTLANTTGNVTVNGDLQVTGNDIRSSTGNSAITLNDTSVTVNGDLYVSGNTTQVNTTSMTVEDRTIELGVVNGSAPAAATTWDLGILFNYNSSGAKKSAVIWEHGDSRFKFAKVLDSDTNGTDVDTPQLSVTGAANYAAIEINALWINDCAGQSQVISCTGTERFLQNITVDAGTF